MNDLKNNTFSLFVFIILLPIILILTFFELHDFGIATEIVAVIVLLGSFGIFSIINLFIISKTIFKYNSKLWQVICILILSFSAAILVPLLTSPYLSDLAMLFKPMLIGSVGVYLVGIIIIFIKWKTMHR